ncbi:MAG: replicative DNA helicase, partial [Oscillospiraceae bacterium]
QILDYAEQKLYEIRAGRDNSEMWRIDSVLFDVIDRLNKMSGPDAYKYRGIPTGFGYLDKVLTGLNKSDLIILAARPGVGKTSLALNIATNIARKTDYAVAMFSLEMSKQQLAQRIISNVSGVSSYAFRTGEVSSEEWVTIAEGMSILTGTGIYLDDTSGISVSEIKSKARRLKNLGLIVVDYLQLMGGSGRRDSRVNEIADITRSFKILAKDLNVPVIVLSQLSRSNEKEAKPRRPRLSDLRDSGSIEQDADIVIFLHRDHVESDDEENSTESKQVTLMVAKNRHGETANMMLGWDGEHTRFSSLEYRDEQ